MKLGIKKQYHLLIWISAMLFISLTIGNITKSSVNDWYVVLNKSILTPPGYMFGVVWSILYIMIASSGWLIWQKKEHSFVKVLFLLQILLNWLWTPLFFGLNLILASLVCLLCLVFILNFLIFKLLQQDIKSKPAILLLPYSIWSLFALYLNFYIWVYN